MGAYGCSWVSTPAFDRVSREGLVFDRAYTPNAKCAPSRAAILTGRNPWQLEEACHHLANFPAKFVTVWEALKSAGYHTGYTHKGWAPGNPGMVDGHPRELTGKAWNDKQLDPPTSGIVPTDYAANFAAFLDATPAEVPFCFWFGCYEPHRVYEYGSGARCGGRSIEDIPHVPAIWPDNEVVRNDLLDYGFELEHYDRHVGLMLADLERRGLLENTLVVVTSDNGMPFPRVKGQEYETSNHLPLAMMWKNGIANPGRRVNQYVSFIDLAPTFLQLAGVDGSQHGMQPITGKSLTDILRDTPQEQRTHLLIGKERHDAGRPDNQSYPFRGVLQDGWLYLRNFFPDRWPAGNPETGYTECDGSPTKTEVLKTRTIPEQRHLWELCFGRRKSQELFHVEEDPDCLCDCIDDPAQTGRVAAMRDLMERSLREQGDPRVLGCGHILDAYPWHNPWLDHYYERFMRRHEMGEDMSAGWINASDIQKPERSVTELS